MDDAGNILIRRYSKSSVAVKSTAATTSEETAIGQDVVKLPGYSLEQEKIFKVREIPGFDIYGESKFRIQSNKFSSLFIL